jgi:hypothetical protein
MVRDWPRSRLVLATMASLTAACMETPANAPDPARTAPRRDALLIEPFDVRAIADAVAAHRGIALKQAIRLAPDEEAALLGIAGPGAASASAHLQDFGLAHVDGSLVAKLSAHYAQGLSGRYDRRTKRIWIRGHDDREARVRAWTLVHEIEHALQDQASWMSRHAQNDDEALAHLALIEGDADITAAGFVASRKLTFDHWLAHLLVSSRDAIRNSNEFGDVPDFVRSQWDFPYLDGTALVGRIYRGGGYALVNRMFDHPPTSTAQVLHPEKYLAGVQPVSVPTPAAPDGYPPLKNGQMGELRTRSFVAPCSGGQDEPPMSWAGDAYAIVGDADKQAVLWSTVWDDESSAHQFEAALRANDSCIRARVGEGVPPTVTILGDGRRVAYVRGLPADAAATNARKLLDAPIETTAASPPLGDVHLAPIADPESFLAKGAPRGGRYVNDPLGLSFSVQGFEVVTTTVDEEISLQEFSGISEVHLTVTAFLTSWTPELEDHLAWDFMGAVEEAQVPIVFLGETDVATGVGPGRALRWSRGQGTNAVMMLVPVCGRRITIGITTSGGGPGVWEDAQRIAKRLRFNEASPACRFVTEDAPSSP